MVSSAAATRRGSIGGTLMGIDDRRNLHPIIHRNPIRVRRLLNGPKIIPNYTQSTLDVIASVKDLGASFGVVSGVLYSNQGRSGGPMMVLVFGAVQSFVRYLMGWLAAAGNVDRLPVWVMCWFVWSGSHAMSFSNTAVVVASVGNFREYSGTIVGIMKGFLGLSPAILVQFYQTIYGNNPTAFILMASLVSTIFPLCLICVAEFHKPATNARIIVSLILLLFLSSPLFYMFRILHENPGETPEITFAGSDGCKGGSAKTYYELPNQSDDEVDDEATDEGPNINLMQAIRCANFCIGHGIMAASGVPGMVHVGSIITGLHTGSQMSIGPPITSEIFGLVDMGTMYNSIMLAGSLVLIFSHSFSVIYMTRNKPGSWGMHELVLVASYRRFSSWLRLTFLDLLFP
ncbi:hypothetical protein AKJ16_DCAP06377 [Drosera capensis]